MCATKNIFRIQRLSWWRRRCLSHDDANRLLLNGFSSDDKKRTTFSTTQDLRDGGKCDLRSPTTAPQPNHLPRPRAIRLRREGGGGIRKFRCVGGRDRGLAFCTHIHKSDNAPPHLRYRLARLLTHRGASWCVPRSTSGKRCESPTHPRHSPAS